SGQVAMAPDSAHGPGRPENVYRLTPVAAANFPDGHRELTGELVEFLSNEQLKNFFEKRAQRLEAEYAPRLAGLDFESRVRELARLRSEDGPTGEGVARGPGSRASTATWQRLSTWAMELLRSATATAPSRMSRPARGCRASTSSR